ncbi:MAG: zinc-ribbon domain-containing protein [Candidatus Bathyarchaeia archaeon]
MEAIVTLGEATALEVSRKTGRSRAAESDYLNQLADRGFLKKTRRGREVIFQVFSLHTICPMCGSRVPLNVNFCSFCGAMLNNPQHSRIINT